MMPQSSQTISIILIILSQTYERFCIHANAGALSECAQTRVIR